MPIPQTVHFDPDAGPLSAQIRIGQAHAGSSGLLLIEHDLTTIVATWRDTFPPDPAAYRLPGPAADHDGRVLDLVAGVGPIDTSGAYAVHLSVTQDGVTLGTASDVGTTTDKTKAAEVAILLSGTPPIRLNRSVERLLGSAKASGKRGVPKRSQRTSELLQETRTLLAKESSPKRKGAKKKGGRGR
jgi:hypothetical protein